ncbi:MAG TPA: GWxTD domain-containing protein [Bacteroidales bacterium]|nr:GWxTD domain-containing protein [Bacteroidales bacterium]
MFRSFVIICCVVLLAACNSQKKAAFEQNQSNIYQPSVLSIRPEYSVFHTSDTLSQLMIKLDLAEILFNQANPENELQAMLRFQYNLVDITSNNNNKEVSDSLTTVKKLVKQQGSDVIIASLNIHAQTGKVYLLNIEVFDMLRNSGQKSFVVIDKTSAYTSQNFRVMIAGSNMPLFRSYIPDVDSVKILLRKNVDRLYIKYARDNTTLALPPFSSQTEPAFVFAADSSWVLPYSTDKVYHFPYKGFYLIQTDSTQSAGLFLSGYDKSYPMVKEVASMISPLEYLSTSEEFRKIKEADDPKLALDNFWLKMGDNVAVSREMIRVFYNRMFYANLYFSSYKPGWKTDRGMIYMVFGPPSYIKKTANAETWEYNIKEEASNLTIKFIKAASPYSFNHYIMQRSDEYTPYWRMAIDSWRSGRVFTLEE